MRFKALDALRGVAAIIVVLYHSRFTTGISLPVIADGPLFVDFFFVLSGFILFYSYRSRLSEGYSIKKFLIMRVGRVYPLHLFMLLLYIPYALLIGYAYNNLGLGSESSLEPYTFTSFISNIFLVHSLGVHEYLSWNQPSWSISVEFYTYILFMVLLIIGLKLRFFLSLAISIMAYALLIHFSPDTILKMVDYGYLRAVGAFFLGGAVFCLREKKKLIFGKWSHAIDLLLLAAIIFSVAGSKRDLSLQITSVFLFALSIYYFSDNESGVLGRILVTPLFQFLGKVSYSIYLTHTIILAVFVNVWKYVLKLSVGGEASLIATPYAFWVNAVILLTVIGFSYLTYHYIEEPFRKRFKKYANTVR